MTTATIKTEDGKWEVHLTEKDAEIGVNDSGSGAYIYVRPEYPHKATTGHVLHWLSKDRRVFVTIYDGDEKTFEGILSRAPGPIDDFGFEYRFFFDRRAPAKPQAQAVIDLGYNEAKRVNWAHWGGNTAEGNTAIEAIRNLMSQIGGEKE